MLDFPLMLQLVKLPVVDRIEPQRNKFTMGVENGNTGVSKLNDNSDAYFLLLTSSKGCKQGQNESMRVC